MNNKKSAAVTKFALLGVSALALSATVVTSVGAQQCIPGWGNWAVAPAASTCHQTSQNTTTAMFLDADGQAMAGTMSSNGNAALIALGPTLPNGGSTTGVIGGVKAIGFPLLNNGSNPFVQTQLPNTANTLDTGRTLPLSHTCCGVQAYILQ